MLFVIHGTNGCRPAAGPPRRRPRTYRLLTHLCVSCAVLVGAARIGRADPQRPDFMGFIPDTNESGFTLADLVDRRTLAMANSPLSPETMSRVSENVHRPPHRGIQFELLTPGDFGATLHFRW